MAPSSKRPSAGCAATLAALLALAAPAPAAIAAVTCAATPANPRGPFHLPDAPFVARLDPPDEPGERIVFSGRVLALPDCRPVAGAVIDVWHASAGGAYYGLGREAGPDRFRLRGRLRTGPDGAFSVVTVRPGRYGAGPARPPHIHVAISADDLLPLTTQVYFPGDPDNAGDELFRAELLGSLQPRAGSPALLRFDFVLSPAGPGR